MSERRFWDVAFSVADALMAGGSRVSIGDISSSFTILEDFND
jgi:hypothetical protein